MYATVTLIVLGGKLRVVMADCYEMADDITMEQNIGSFHHFEEFSSKTFSYRLHSFIVGARGRFMNRNAVAASWGRGPIDNP
jgi:hypothetical protein